MQQRRHRVEPLVVRIDLGDEPPLEAVVHRRARREDAWKMHDDLRKSMSDGMLKHSLIAAFNTEVRSLQYQLAGLVQ